AKDYDAFLARPAVIAMGSSGAIVHYDSETFDQYHRLLGQGVTSFHQAYQIDPATGQPAGEPVMVSGPEDAASDPSMMPVPGSTVYLMAADMGTAIDSGQAQSKRFEIDNI